MNDEGLLYTRETVISILWELRTNTDRAMDTDIMKIMKKHSLDNPLRGYDQDQRNLIDEYIIEHIIIRERAIIERGIKRTFISTDDDHKKIGVPEIEFRSSEEAGGEYVDMPDQWSVQCNAGCDEQLDFQASIDISDGLVKMEGLDNILFFHKVVRHVVRDLRRDGTMGYTV